MASLEPFKTEKTSANVPSPIFKQWFMPAGGTQSKKQSGPLCWHCRYTFSASLISSSYKVWNTKAEKKKMGEKRDIME